MFVICDGGLWRYCVVMHFKTADLREFGDVYVLLTLFADSNLDFQQRNDVTNYHIANIAATWHFELKTEHYVFESDTKTLT